MIFINLGLWLVAALVVTLFGNTTGLAAFPPLSAVESAIHGYDETLNPAVASTTLSVISAGGFRPQVLPVFLRASNNEHHAGAVGLAPNPFTGTERDAETGLDYFGAWYFTGAQGRFTSPDEWQGGPVDPFTGQQVQPPGPLPYADIRNPQSLNKYAYMMNNPLRYIDPDGHCVWDLCVAEGTGVYLVGAAAVTTAAYMMTPQGQENTKKLVVGAAAAIGGILATVFNQSSDDSGNTPPPPPPAGAQQQSTTATPPPPPGSGNQGDDRTGGGKTGRKQNFERAKSAQEKLTEAKENLANLNKQNPRPQGFQKALQQAKDQVKHWTKKVAEKSEEHARVHQR